MAAHKNIYMALAAAQSEFGTVTKGATNPAFKSKYADLSDVAGVVIPTLSNHGVCVLHYIVKFGEEDAMRTEFVHGESETRVSCDVPLIVEKKNMQGMKSATTYAKRIGLESLSGIAPEDDDGNAASAAPPKQQQRPQTRPITADEYQAMVSLMDETNTTDEAFAKHLGVCDLFTITDHLHGIAMAKLREKKARMSVKVEGA